MSVATILSGNLRINSLKTVNNYHTINFPAYKIKEPVIKDGLVYSENKLIDDTNIKEETLGLRRLKTPLKVGNLKTYREDIVDLIKDSTSTEEWYIDYLGNIFLYRKTTKERLICHKIAEVINKDTYSIIVVKDVNFPIIVDRPPTGSYAQMLYFGDFPWKLYNVLSEYSKPTYKKV